MPEKEWILYVIEWRTRLCFLCVCPLLYLRVCHVAGLFRS